MSLEIRVESEVTGAEGKDDVTEEKGEGEATGAEGESDVTGIERGWGGHWGRWGGEV